ncbi:MAG: YihY/virulence factor BrkB family protein [Muribaculaceae bacterium]|nr:YihY/virulence factor BrkB family protein [Muribaculaceae bacterium]
MNQRLERLKTRVIAAWEYCSDGVWKDTRRNWWVTAIKTLNLSIRTFLSGDVQTQACAMTYRTLLALVPALALLLAIARGFGFQGYLEAELYRLFPAQETAIRYAWNFVDSYLNQASEGLFVGVGIVFLLYTLVSLISTTEDTFNSIWGVRQGRSLARKISDYTSLLLILPILVVCVSGIELMLSSTLRAIFSLEFMTPVVSCLLEVSSWILTFLFFGAVYLLFPNTRVPIPSALISGVFAGVGFLVVQWLFVTGQMYVSRYNAIYGSFAFLPLLLIWLQLVWMITLAGAVLCYSSANIFSFSFDQEVKNIAPLYRRKAFVAVATILTHRFEAGQPAVTTRELIENYELPGRLVNDIFAHLIEAGIVAQVVLDAGKRIYAYQLSVPAERMTIAFLFDKLNTLGLHGFIPEFSLRFPGVEETFKEISEATEDTLEKIYLKDIQIQPISKQQI